MQNLEEKTWGEFRIGDMFEVSRPTARKKEDYPSGDVPFVASGNMNNGVIKLCEPNKNEPLDKGCCITVSPVDGRSFFQPLAFLGRGGAGSSILILRHDELNLYCGQFIARLIQQTCSKYTYGHMGNKESIKRERILLPVTDSGEPDYGYMTKYTQQICKTLLAKYCTYLEERLDELGEVVEIPSLDEKHREQMPAFGDGAPLSIQTTHSSIDKVHLIEDGEKLIPYITRSDTNNGLAHFVSVNNFEFGYDNGDCITVGLDTQTAFYQPHRFITGQNIQIITCENMNEYIAQFLVPILRQQMTAKFNWGGNGATLSRMKKLSIMLPVTNACKPEFDYMEQYIKNIMIHKYRQYLTYLKSMLDI